MRFRFNGLNTVFDSQTEEAFADVHGFILLYKNFGHSQEMMNLLDLWIFRREAGVRIARVDADRDIAHDSSLALIELRQEIRAHRLPEDKDIIAYSLKLVQSHPALLTVPPVL